MKNMPPVPNVAKCFYNNSLKRLSRLPRNWESRVNPSHQLDGIINRIPERVFSRGRWPAIQARQSPNQEHSGHEIDQFLPAFVHQKDKISRSL
jgi:hypothetical protein